MSNDKTAPETPVLNETSTEVETKTTKNPFKRLHKFAKENDLYGPIIMIGAAGISLATVVLSAKDTQNWLFGLDRIEALEENYTMLLESDDLSDAPDELTEE